MEEHSSRCKLGSWDEKSRTKLFREYVTVTVSVNYNSDAIKLSGQAEVVEVSRLVLEIKLSNSNKKDSSHFPHQWMALWEEYSKVCKMTNL